MAVADGLAAVFQAVNVAVRYAAVDDIQKFKLPAIKRSLGPTQPKQFYVNRGNFRRCERSTKIEIEYRQAERST